MALCTGCGNEVPDPHDCPICKAGRGMRKPVPEKEPSRNPEPVALDDDRTYCPRCRDPLEQQDWEGTPTLCCPSCRGTFFPDRALESVLDKLRAAADPVDVSTVLKDFKERFTRELPDAVLYKACPVCRQVMTRRNYGTVSGVIVDTCNEHGTWVDEAQFASLADFICRGGDVLASEIGKVRARIASRSSRSGPTLFERFLGADR